MFRIEFGLRHIINCRDHATNEEVHAKIQQAIGPHEDLQTAVKRRKLKWYEHTSSSSGLAKTILQSTVKGGRRQGRQKKRWETTLGNGQALSSLRELVVKTSVVSQGPLRLRDRCRNIIHFVYSFVHWDQTTFPSIVTAIQTKVPVSFFHSFPAVGSCGRRN